MLEHLAGVMVLIVSRKRVYRVLHYPRHFTSLSLSVKDGLSRDLDRGV